MKLDDIKKRHIHKVPEKYFDELPQIIQSKVVSSQSRKSRLYTGLKYALPAFIIILIAGYFGFFNNVTTESPEELLATVNTEDLIIYLENTDITTEEILEQVDIEVLERLEFEEEAEIINGLNEDDLDQLLNEYRNSEDIL